MQLHRSPHVTNHASIQITAAVPHRTQVENGIGEVVALVPCAWKLEAAACVKRGRRRGSAANMTAAASAWIGLEGGREEEREF